MTKTTVCMPVSHSVVPYSDLQATPKQVYLIRMLLNLCGLFHSYSLPSVALGSSAAQHTSQRSHKHFVSITPIQN